LQKFSKEPGVVLSALAHVSALVLMLVALPVAKPFDDAVESVPVEVMTASQFAALTEGSRLQEKPTDNPKPKAIQADKPKQAKTDTVTDKADKPSLLPPPAAAEEPPASKNADKKADKKADTKKPDTKKPETKKLADKKPVEPKPTPPKPADVKPAETKPADSTLEEPPPLRTASLPPKKAEPKPVDKAQAAKDEQKAADEVIRQLQAEQEARAKQAEAKVQEEKVQKDKAKADKLAEAKKLADAKLIADAAAKAEADKQALADAADAEKQAAAKEAATAKKLAAKKAADEKKLAEATQAAADAEAQRVADEKAAADQAAADATTVKKLAEAEKAKAAADAKKKAAAKLAADEKLRKDKLAALIKSRQASDRSQPDGTDENQLNATNASAATRADNKPKDAQSAGGSKRTGSSLSPAQKEGLANAIIDQLRSCVTNLSGDTISELPRIRISIAVDGSLQAMPQIISANDPAATALARAAIRGARGCAPFTIPGQYQSAMAEAQGADLTLTLNPSELQ
jgi:colicin import membrane protein